MLAKEVLVFFLRIGALALAQSCEVFTLVRGQEVGFTLVIKINRDLAEVESLLLQSIKQRLDQLPLTFSQSRCFLSIRSRLRR